MCGIAGIIGGGGGGGRKRIIIEGSFKKKGIRHN